MTKSIEFSAVMGIVAGYKADEVMEKAKEIDEHAMEASWQKAADAVFEEMNEYITATVTRTGTVYKYLWGCPEGCGEPCYILEGVMNPKYVKDPNRWRKAVEECVKRVKADFKQSRVQLVFREVDWIYFE